MAKVKWKKGDDSPNPTGRPKNPDNASPLRATYSKLKGLEPKAFAYISQIVKDELPKLKMDDGTEHPTAREAINKERFNASKWVIDSVVTLRKAVVADEAAMRDSGANGDEEIKEVEEETPQQVTKRFQVYDFDRVEKEITPDEATNDNTTSS